ncbi:DUF4362 domain-containing protein [Rossellomorea vietnamensis]|uniref:DUF4362 domain-containing protein n=1 Tax=Rossellomorea vietnamensis TaxID=218284 RepID=A0A5D4NSD2_9BACI|nr:DUF4362 domain-containing protein [Rossellomorea vietnamensis]TYS17087.1 DUF4362 domain-containing protein [Rossellomorea vietnamensis]
MRKLYSTFIVLFLLSGCGQYSPSKHDVVNTHGNIENLRLLENFIENVSMDRDSKVRVVNYTDEGDPIIHDLNYSNDLITSVKDTREDEFGDQLVMENVCESIKKIDKNNLTFYQLQGCNGKETVIHVTIISDD